MDDRAHVDAADGSSADVVPLRRRPEELVDDRYLLDALLENTHDHVYFKDSQSRFVRISHALAAWLGLSDAAEAIGHTDFDFFGEPHAQKAFADEQRLMRTGEPLLGIEEAESWADGRCTWVSTTKVPRPRCAQGQVALFPHRASTSTCGAAAAPAGHVSLILRDAALFE